MELSEIQARAAKLEQQISNLPAGSRITKAVNGKNISTIVGRRTKSGGKNTFPWMR
ncbi:MAG: hypothetical protein ACLTSZ_08310 [Lachnospiraceae bacterium]